MPLLVVASPKMRAIRVSGDDLDMLDVLPMTVRQSAGAATDDLQTYSLSARDYYAVASFGQPGAGALEGSLFFCRIFILASWSRRRPPLSAREASCSSWAWSFRW